MRISARADYAVRATVAIAQAEDALISADAVAESQSIPRSFLEGILTSLRRAEIVTSRRGAAGGYRLAKTAREVSVADVIRAVDGPLVYVRDARPSDVEYVDEHEALAALWVALRANVRIVLEATTIADLAVGSLPASVQALADEPRAWLNASPLGD
ncbi:MAG: transcriptional regulator [Tistrella sp.]|nr:transcriptional regulator [Tistrella sp.]